MRILHIVASPRGADSNTLRVSASLLDALTAANPGAEVETLNLFSDELPAVAGDNIESKYSLMARRPLDPSHAESWKAIEATIQQFLAADTIVISTPMWNFNVPYALKYYIDAVVQPGYLFTYNDQGVPVGLVEGKRMICVTSRGGDYSVAHMQPYDFQEPYLRAIFGFVGIRDIQFINAQPMDVSPDLREAAVAAAVASIGTVAETAGV